ncbi:hypothetical protein N656DRAFT_784752 [Canariomyces notabilis]|uniref:Uncharacterized protein n=1 Tax=Canariomyces notabilis TaxID=2074819 RepID=A0AAN6QD80_9PEZI|nr:hypothetical protein N656DRAFT_784752 [Canariomyces arenarius]
MTARDSRRALRGACALKAYLSLWLSPYFTQTCSVAIVSGRRDGERTGQQGTPAWCCCQHNQRYPTLPKVAHPLNKTQDR